MVDYDWIKDVLYKYIKYDLPHNALYEVLIRNKITPCYKFMNMDKVYLPVEKNILLPVYFNVYRLGQYENKVLYALVSYVSEIRGKDVKSIEFIEIEGQCSTI